MPSNPASEITGYTLEIVREPAGGPVTAILVGHPEWKDGPAVWSDDGLVSLLRLAREIDGDRDPSSEMMPQGEAIIRAGLAELCIEVDGKPADADLIGWDDAEEGR